MKRRDVKSNCPVNFTMEIFGDPWSILIVRGMLTYGAKTFSDFLRPEERIGRSVLAEKLSHLEKSGIIEKHRDGKDHRSTNYRLTKNGLDFLPVMYEIFVWGSNTSLSPKTSEAWFKAMKLDKDIVVDTWRKAIETNSSFYIGQNSVVKQLGL